MALTLIIIFCVGLLLGLAAGIPALKRRSRSVEFEPAEDVSEERDGDLFSEYVETDEAPKEYAEDFSDDPAFEDDPSYVDYEVDEAVDTEAVPEPTDDTDQGIGEITVVPRPEPEIIEGRLLGPGAARTTKYDAARCAEFVTALGDDVLERAAVMFQVLTDRGHVDSLSLATALDSTPARLGGILTARLKRRATDMNLELPYDVKRVQGRTTWRDHSGIAERMVIAIRSERGTRARGAPSDPTMTRGL